MSFRRRSDFPCNPFVEGQTRFEKQFTALDSSSDEFLFAPGVTYPGWKAA